MNNAPKCDKMLQYWVTPVRKMEKPEEKMGRGGEG